MSRLTTIILIIILLGMTGALLAIVVTPKRQATTFPHRPSMTLPVAETILTISSSPISPRSTISTPSAATAFYSTDVIIDTGNNKVTAVQLELSFNQELTKVSIKPGSFFKNPIELLNRVDNQKGTISFALGTGVVRGRIKGVRGKGTVATIYFEEKGTPGKYAQINFLPKTLVVGAGTARSVLKSTVPAVFPIGGIQSATGSSRQIYSP